MGQRSAIGRLAALLLFGTATLVAAEEAAAQTPGAIPGADDPALIAAAEAWLRDRDPRASLWAIGELAADGNTAARQLAQTVFRELHSDFPDMSREERRALFPPDRIEKPSRFGPPYRMRDRSTASRLMGEMNRLTAPEDWIARAEALLAAGHRQQFKGEVVLAISGNRSVDIEAVQFAEGFLNPSDPEMVEVWLFRQIETSHPGFHGRGESTRPDREARWGGPPWSPKAWESFAAALRDERWSAVRASGLLRQLGADLPLDPATEALYRRWLVRCNPDGSPCRGADGPVTEADLVALAALLRRDAPRTAHIRPFLRACDAACPSEADMCLAKGTLLYPLHRFVGNSGLEPVLPFEAYLDSWRVERLVLIGAGLDGRRKGFGPEWLRMPQCFRAAATAEIDRVWPEQP